VGLKSVSPIIIDRDPDESHVCRTTTAAAVAAVGLPDPKAIPRRVTNAVQELPLDPGAAFVLEQIDGRTSVQDILDGGTLPRFATLDAICRLVELGVIAFL
jgi:hypothetical protein